MSEQLTHQPVMLHEAISWLNIKPGQWYLDATFGRGGHTREILAHGGHVIAFDIDQEAVNYGEHNFAKEIANHQLILNRANFEDVQTVAWQNLVSLNIHSFSGALFDFGTSIEQLTNSARGFSFQENGPLDMRLDDRLGVTAADMLNALAEKQLADLFRDYGGESRSKAIAKAVVRQRSIKPFTQTAELIKLIERIVPRTGRLHPATKTFQALRIAVNRELDVIKPGLRGALALISDGARIVTIAFHEGEDRIAKEEFNKWEENGQGVKLTSKPLLPSEEEVKQNSKARSAKMRVFEKRS